MSSTEGAQDPVDKFINDLIEAKDYSGMDLDSNREAIKADIKRHLFEQIDRAMVEALPEDKIDEVMKIWDEDDAQGEAALKQAIADSGIDQKTIVAQVMLNFRTFYLGGDN